MCFLCLASSTVPRFCRSAGLFSEHAVNTLRSLGSDLDAGGSPDYSLGFFYKQPLPCPDLCFSGSRAARAHSKYAELVSDFAMWSVATYRDISNTSLNSFDSCYSHFADDKPELVLGHTQLDAVEPDSLV